MERLQPHKLVIYLMVLGALFYFVRSIYEVAPSNMDVGIFSGLIAGWLLRTISD